MPPESDKENRAAGLGGRGCGLQALFMGLGSHGSWQVPSGWVSEILHQIWASSPHLDPTLKVDRRWLGTQPSMGNWGRAVQVFAMVPQQRCAGEEGLAPGGSMSTGLGSFYLQMWSGKGHLLIGMGKAGWKTRRLAEVAEGEALLCRQL